MILLNIMALENFQFDIKIRTNYKPIEIIKNMEKNRPAVMDWVNTVIIPLKIIVTRSVPKHLFFGKFNIIAPPLHMQNNYLVTILIIFPGT